MKIGQLARKTGFSVQTIRYYEQQGLLSPAARSESNYRLYGPQALQQLDFIKHCRSLNISLHDIKKMLEIRQFPERSCEAIDHMMANHLHKVRVRIRELNSLKSSLANMLKTCQGENAVGECGILRTLDR
ncbi:Cd(II)/Pb(II)-responsive transcriptional regulator [Aliiglaciecola sp. LCG003]|uniref:Cd(II)/Pb(II)-responsive transcriptional regulator n=1 Tax=Aliiglaciecola sp. LCG003 TaxID=3053655 RepID=UPI00257461C8|nr:Cd(II)/Pb(II)-responsive transcriptional regulator [Aliiglaciecola sp. LCG003]WJG09641.1 Cd(II)/Pb(II)-responsive transcriptional regulator [Aliiglaciecola sp. LCG003]